MNVQGYIPAMPAPVQTPRAMAAASSGSSGTGSGNSATSSSSLQTTFLNLLITELQNQDPTSPVDPTQMVGQMVSLNQLDQLISINQTLQGMTSASTGTGGSTAGTGSTQSATKPATAASQATTNVFSNPVGTSMPTMPYADASTGAGFMNLYGGYGMPTANSQSTLRGAK